MRAFNCTATALPSGPQGLAVTFVLTLFAVILALSFSSSFATTYQYDELNRLTRVDYGNGSAIDYAYDAAGNRTSRTVTGAGGAPVLVVAPTSLSLPATLSSGSITITNTGSGILDWTVSIPMGGGWLSIVGNSAGTGDGSITYSAQQNTSAAPRHGEIRFVASGADNSPTTVTVTQAAASSPFVVAWGQPLGVARAAAMTRLTPTGSLSVYLTRRLESNVVYRSDDLPDSIYSFTPPSLAHTGDGMATLWFDHGNDGRLDPLILNVGGPQALFQNIDGFNFGNISGQILADLTGARTAEALDFDNDGDLDLFLTRTPSASDLLLESTPGGYVDATPASLNVPFSSTASAAGDFDNDGDLDLYVVRWNSPNALVRNDGGGVWVEVTPQELSLSAAGTGAAWGDYDNDGRLDLAVTNADAPPRVFRNVADDFFVDVTPSAIAADSSNGNVSWVDINNDTDLDLFYTRGPGQDRLLRNSGGGFEVWGTPTLSDGGNHAGAAWGDVDDDGDMDLFQAEYDVGLSRMLLNRIEDENSWLEIDLEGTRSNRMGVGARIEAFAGGVRMLREVQCSAGNRSQNMLTAHFGLGATSEADSVVVYWPSGTRQAVHGVVANQKLLLVEPSPTATPEVPLRSSLRGATPNPFNPSTTIAYSTAEAGHVELTIYDMAGRQVRALVSESLDAGEHSVTWNGRDDSGHRVASGVYLYRLKAGEFEQTKRMVLLK